MRGPTVWCVGAGAIGGNVASRLVRAGVAPVVVGADPAHVAPGRVRLDADGPLTLGRLGEFDAAADAAGVEDDRGLARAAAVLGEAFRVRITADVRADLWSKMLTNSVTVLGAVGGMLLGEVLAPERRPLVRAVLAEGASVAAASGITARSVFGARTALVVDRSPGWEAAIDAACDKAAVRFGAVRSVTWRDFELGRPTEIEAVTGEIVKRGEELGVAVPVNAAVLGVLRSIESGALRPDAAHVATLMKECG